MRPPGKRQQVGKNSGNATVAIATARVSVDTNFERQCLLGRAALVKGRKDEFNRVLSSLNIDLDWAMLEQTWRETSSGDTSDSMLSVTWYSISALLCYICLLYTSPSPRDS